SALLQAVSHDLRTPLAVIKAAASSLQEKDVDWAPDDSEEFISTIVEETDRLIALVANLLDMSRLQVGALQSSLRPVAVDEVVLAALASLGPRASAVDLHLDEPLPPVVADPALLERAVANVVDNAVRWSPPGQPVRIETGAFGDRVDLRIVDRGPGIPLAMRQHAFAPFPPLSDPRPGTRVALALAVPRGSVQSMRRSVATGASACGGAWLGS